MQADNRKSIIEMAMGAIQERADYEMSKIIDNIIDVNTNPTKKRQLILTITFEPDDKREVIKVSAQSKSKLEPTSPVVTALYIGADADGEVSAVEMVPQIPGQQNLFGGEQEEPKQLKIVKKA